MSNAVNMVLGNVSVRLTCGHTVHGLNTTPGHADKLFCLRCEGRGVSPFVYYNAFPGSITARCVQADQYGDSVCGWSREYEDVPLLFNAIQTHRERTGHVVVGFFKSGALEFR